MSRNAKRPGACVLVALLAVSLGVTASGQLPAGTDAGPPQGSGARWSITDATIGSVTPLPIVPEAPFMVNVAVTITGQTTQRSLAESLRVFVNAVPVVLRSQEAAANDGQVLTEKARVTLFGTVPKEAWQPLPQGSTAEAAAVTVFSSIDQREIAAKVVAIAQPQPEPTLRLWLTSNMLLVGLVLAALASVLFALLQWRRSTRRIGELEAAVRVEQQKINRLGPDRGDHGGPDSGAHEGFQELTALPEDVVTALLNGQLVVVAGPDVSAVAGVPTGRLLWLNVIEQIGDRSPAASTVTGAVPETTLDGLRGILTTDSPEAVVEPMLSLFGRAAVLAQLETQLDSTGRSSRLHQLLAQLPVRTFIDLNWDDVLRQSLPQATVVSPKRSHRVAGQLRSTQVTVIKPYGELREPESVSLTPREVRRGLSQAPELERAMAALYSSHTWLFIGVNLKGLEALLTALPPELEGGSRAHLAIVADEPGIQLWEAGAGRLYNVRIARYRPSSDGRELIATVQSLVERQSSTSVARTQSPDALDAPAKWKLRRVELKSIGIFRSLSVEFGPGWTLLLGDNGGGKSTILRSIALALAGNDARAAPAAARLLRTGDNDGTVEVHLGPSRLITTLARDGAVVQMRSPQTTPLQGGQLLVLAFPALRGITSKHPSGPKAMASPDPSVADVLPLLDGAVDTRLNDLKQWIVNVVMRAEAAPGGRDAQMLATFTRLIADMVPGGGIHFGGVDRSDWRIYVNTRDGAVPLDSVSQGMSAILNWIGVLLQRLYDTYPGSAAPEQEAAIVLIDEIDAHLHPKWQRQIVTLARHHFKNVQMIASSHSPLLAGAVERFELRVVARDSETGDMRAAPPPEDLAGQKAEDILVSSMFALPTTRSVDAERTINRYFELYQKLAPSPAEEAELEELRGKVEALNYGPSGPEKQQLAELDSKLTADLDRISTDTLHALERLRTPERQSEKPS